MQAASSSRMLRHEAGKKRAKFIFPSYLIILDNEKKKLIQPRSERPKKLPDTHWSNARATLGQGQLKQRTLRILEERNPLPPLFSSHL